MDEMTARVFRLMQAKTPAWGWADLARALGTTDQRLYNWRKRRIPPEVHGQLADALGVSMDCLTGRTEPPDNVDPKVPALSPSLITSYTHATPPTRELIDWLLAADTSHTLNPDTSRQLLALLRGLAPMKPLTDDTQLLNHLNKTRE